MDEVPNDKGATTMGMKFNYVRPPTLRETEALRAQAKAKADKQARRLADAAKKAVADAEASAKAKANAEAKAQDAQHPVSPFGFGERFRAANLVWREWASGATHVEAIATGFEVPDRKGFADIKACVDQTLAFHAATGQHFSEFFVNNKEGQRIGSGFFEADTTASDIAFLFAALAARGFTGHVAYVRPANALLMDDFILAKLKPVVDDVAALSFEDADAGEVMALIQGLEPGVLADVIDGDELTGARAGTLSVIRTAVETFRAAYPMPAFGDKPLCVRLRHGFNNGVDQPHEYLRFEAGEQLPDSFSAMWHAERDRYRTILASCPARNFRIYDVRDKTEEPMTLYEMRGEFPYTFAKVGEAVASDGEGGGFFAACHGSFHDDTPSAETLAFISCRLAASGRWLTLVPHIYDFCPPEIHALMSGTTEEPK